MSDHLAQMAQVQQLLSLDPTNAELLKLQTDLAQIISLTLGAAAVPPLVTVVGSAGEVEEGGAPHTRSAKWNKDDRCMALWEDGQHYLAKINNHVTGTDAYEVTYLQYGNTAVIPEASIRPYSAAPSLALVPGARVRALMAEDGLFYDATIHAKVEGHANMYTVRFAHKKKKDFLVSGDDIVLRDEKAAANPTAVPDEVEIPEHLKWDPNDNEQTKAKKRRMVKNLKLNHKKQKQEVEMVEKQSGWKNFQATKGQKLKGVRKAPSIFASGQGPVGVGSGNTKLTQNPTLKKHVFEYMADKHVVPKLDD